MSTIENKTYWDVRELSALATKNYEIVVDEESDEQDKEDAKRVLEILGEALVSFGRTEFIPQTEEQHKAFWEDDEDEESDPYIYGADIAGLWEEIGDSVHVTLIAENEVTDYVEEMSTDFGWLTDETPEFIKSAIDWDQVADTLKSNSEGGSIELDGQTYWVGL